MTVKEKTEALLRQSLGEYLSGEEIAARLGVTRAAVWKGIEALRAEGLEIDAVTNRGYRLLQDVDALSADGVKAHLKTPLRVEVYDAIPSTNLLAKERAATGEAEGLLVIADSQTAGRGRLGRSFLSPSGTGLYMSLLLRPKLRPDRAVRITAAAAVAVAEAIAKLTGRTPGIKWVNDLFMDGLKVCGILTEASMSLESGGLDYAVLGIGINVCAPEGGFPEDLREIAGALFPERQADMRCRLVAMVADCFMELYADLDSPEIVERYRALSIVPGHPVTVLARGEARPALALSVDDECRLVVRYPDGGEEALSSGEISVRFRELL